MACLFCKLRDQSGGNAIFEDEHCFVLQDLHPQAPVHLLIIPKKHLASPDAAEAEDELLLGHLLRVGQGLARDRGIAQQGYRLVMNCNAQGGQTVFHLHLHLLGGRQMAWPPG